LIRELQQLRLLTDRLPDGIVTIDPQLEVVYANLAGRRALHPAQIVVGQVLPDVWDSFSLRRFATALFDPRAIPRTEEVRLEDGRTLLLTGLPARGGSTSGLVIEDITARQRRERAQQEFVANAAHELLTPLTGIAGAAHVLEAGAKDDPETRDKFLDHIARECNRLARIARALLVLARATSGEEPPRPELVSLRSLLDDAIDAVGGDDNVELDCPDELTVFVDRDLAEQAFTNLVANAKRHSDGAGVVVSAGVSDGQLVGVDILDSGPGIPIEQGERVQRRFTSGVGRDGSGFGLGLSIAAQAVHAVGGTLDLNSQPGAGTRARVELPAGRIDSQ
jgi:signal transduction histidine kinase